MTWGMKMNSDERNPWDWGVLLTKDGEIVPPGACEGYHNE